jgi:hypothetical protein
MLPIRGLAVDAGKLPIFTTRISTLGGANRSYHPPAATGEIVSFFPQPAYNL